MPTVHRVSRSFLSRLGVARPPRTAGEIRSNMRRDPDYFRFEPSMPPLAAAAAAADAADDETEEDDARGRDDDGGDDGGGGCGIGREGIVNPPSFAEGGDARSPRSVVGGDDDAAESPPAADKRGDDDAGGGPLRVDDAPPEGRVDRRTDAPVAGKTTGRARVSEGPSVGVSRSGKRWMVQIYYHGKSRYMGRFDSRERANTANVNARRALAPTVESKLTKREIELNVRSAVEAARAGANDGDATPAPAAPESNYRPDETSARPDAGEGGNAGAGPRDPPPRPGRCGRPSGRERESNARSAEEAAQVSGANEGGATPAPPSPGSRDLPEEILALLELTEETTQAVGANEGDGTPAPPAPESGNPAEEMPAHLEAGGGEAPGVEPPHPGTSAPPEAGEDDDAEAGPPHPLEEPKRPERLSGKERGELVPEHAAKNGRGAPSWRQFVGPDAPLSARNERRDGPGGRPTKEDAGGAKTKTIDEPTSAREGENAESAPPHPPKRRKRRERLSGKQHGELVPERMTKKDLGPPLRRRFADPDAAPSAPKEKRSGPRRRATKEDAGGAKPQTNDECGKERGLGRRPRKADGTEVASKAGEFAVKRSRNWPTKDGSQDATALEPAVVKRDRGRPGKDSGVAPTKRAKTSTFLDHCEEKPAGVYPLKNGKWKVEIGYKGRRLCFCPYSWEQALSLNRAAREKLDPTRNSKLSAREIELNLKLAKEAALGAISKGEGGSNADERGVVKRPRPSQEGRRRAKRPRVGTTPSTAASGKCAPAAAQSAGENSDYHLIVGLYEKDGEWHVSFHSRGKRFHFGRFRDRERAALVNEVARGIVKAADDFCKQIAKIARSKAIIPGKSAEDAALDKLLGEQSIRLQGNLDCTGSNLAQAPSQPRKAFESWLRNRKNAWKRCRQGKWDQNTALNDDCNGFIQGPSQPKTAFEEWLRNKKNTWKQYRQREGNRNEALSDATSYIAENCVSEYVHHDLEKVQRERRINGSGGVDASLKVPLDQHSRQDLLVRGDRVGRQSLSKQLPQPTVDVPKHQTGLGLLAKAGAEVRCSRVIPPGMQGMAYQAAIIAAISNMQNCAGSFPIVHKDVQAAMQSRGEEWHSCKFIATLSRMVEDGELVQCKSMYRLSSVVLLALSVPPQSTTWSSAKATEKNNISTESSSLKKLQWEQQPFKKTKSTTNGMTSDVWAEVLPTYARSGTTYQAYRTVIITAISHRTKFSGTYRNIRKDVQAVMQARGEKWHDHFFEEVLDLMVENGDLGRCMATYRLKKVTVTVAKPSKECALGICLSQENHGVQVVSIDTFSLLFDTNLRAGMVLENINRHKCSTVAEAVALARKAESLVTILATVPNTPKDGAALPDSASSVMADPVPDRHPTTGGVGGAPQPYSIYYGRPPADGWGEWGNGGA